MFLFAKYCTDLAKHRNSTGHAEFAVAHADFATVLEVLQLSVAVLLKLWSGMKSMRPFFGRIADLWCQMMHIGIMWPSHGHYECSTCGRRYRVCWEEASPVTAGGQLLPWPLDFLPMVELAK